MNNQEKVRIDKNWKWCQTYWERKSKELKIQDWGFGMNHTKRSLAICDYTKRTIFISSYFLRGENCNEKSMRNSILHEIAHALAGSKNGHNEEWKRIALSIGCDGHRCGSMDKPKGSYLMVCPNFCFKQEYYRKPKVEGKVCLKCKSTPKIITIGEQDEEKEIKHDHRKDEKKDEKKEIKHIIIKLPPLPPLPKNLPTLPKIK